MTISELQWLKGNIDNLSVEDYELLETLEIIPFIQKGEVHLPIDNLLNAMEVTKDVIGKYIDSEEINNLD